MHCSKTSYEGHIDTIWRFLPCIVFCEDTFVILDEIAEGKHNNDKAIEKTIVTIQNDLVDAG